MTAPRRSLMSTYAAFLSLRMVLFLAALGVCMLLGLRGLLAVVVALLVSAIVSYPIARRQRDQIVDAMRNRQRK